jgi:hypothetical protein
MATKGGAAMADEPEYLKALPLLPPLLLAQRLQVFGFVGHRCSAFNRGRWSLQ